MLTLNTGGKFCKRMQRKGVNTLSISVGTKSPKTTHTHTNTNGDKNREKRPKKAHAHTYSYSLLRTESSSAHQSRNISHFNQMWTIWMWLLTPFSHKFTGFSRHIVYTQLFLGEQNVSASTGNSSFNNIDETFSQTLKNAQKSHLKKMKRTRLNPTANVFRAFPCMKQDGN